MRTAHDKKQVILLVILAVVVLAGGLISTYGENGGRIAGSTVAVSAPAPHRAERPIDRYAAQPTAHPFNGIGG